MSRGPARPHSGVASLPDDASVDDWPLASPTTDEASVEDSALASPLPEDPPPDELPPPSPGDGLTQT